MGKKSLLIGINYIGTDAELMGCISDTQVLKHFLLANAQYSPNDTVVLTDKSVIKPTRVNIENAMKNLVANAKWGDILFLSYSGHGSKIRDTNGDEKDSNDEVLVPLDYKSAGVISDDWIRENVIQKVPENVFLFCLFDCCNSGSCTDLKYAWNYMGEQKIQNKIYKSIEWTNRFSFGVESKLDCKGNVIVFSGCQDPQTSADVTVNGVSGGAFTNAFIEFIKGHLIKYSNGTVIFDNAKIKYREVLKEINARLKLRGYPQRSVLSSSNIENFEKTISF